MVYFKHGDSVLPVAKGTKVLVLIGSLFIDPLIRFVKLPKRLFNESSAVIEHFRIGERAMKLDVRVGPHYAHKVVIAKPSIIEDKSKPWPTIFEYLRYSFYREIYVRHVYQIGTFQELQAFDETVLVLGTQAMLYPAAKDL